MIIIIIIVLAVGYWMSATLMIIIIIIIIVIGCRLLDVGDTDECFDEAFKIDPRRPENGPAVASQSNHCQHSATAQKPDSNYDSASQAQPKASISAWIPDHWLLTAD